MDLTTKHCLPCQGTDSPLTEAEAKRFLNTTPGWEFQQGAHHICRTFSFSNFANALAFVNQVAELSERENHHPEIVFGWGYATITFFTHKINGLHENDFVMAAKINYLESLS